MPKLSVIVPVYNVEAYLTVCIDSILTQTLSDLELILIDDGSPDNCGSICDAYAAKDPRVKVIHQKNSGVSAARNAGLEIACGEYIGFVDPDDFVVSNAYEALICAAEQAKAQIGIFGFMFCTETGVPMEDSKVPAGVYDRTALIASIYGMPNQLHGSMCNKVFAKALLTGLKFDEQVAIGEDWLLLYECYLRADRAVAVDFCGYTVRNRSGSATRKVTAQLYVNKQKTYYRLYTYAAKQNEEIQRRAVAKILDTCYTNKQHIISECYDRNAVRFINCQLRHIAMRELMRGHLSLKHAVYHFWKGLLSK